MVGAVVMPRNAALLLGWGACGLVPRKEWTYLTQGPNGALGLPQNRLALP